jgi:hypothetical protein
MAELDKIPQKQSIEIEIAKVDETIYERLKELNQKSNLLIGDFGNIHIRKKELADELVRLDEILEKAEAEFKVTNSEINETLDKLDEEYPQGRINMQDGTIQYQPGAPTRKQLAEQQKQQALEANKNK